MTRLFNVDPDRVRAAKLAEPEIRAQLLVLYAFHMELAKVPDHVSEPLIGQIRYQWWRDCLDEIYGDRPVRNHEISLPLRDMVGQTRISRFMLERIIDGRERDLDPRPFTSIREATDYADATSGALMRAAMSVLGSDRGHYAGRAWGLTGLARSYRYYAETMLQHLRFDQILTAAEDAYHEARGISRGDTMPAIGYVALIPGFLKRMRQKDYNPLVDIPDYAPFRKQLRLLGAVATGRL